MDKLDVKLVAHIGVELVVIAGMFFYLRKQINDLQAKVENLEKQNEYYKKAIETHDNYIRQIMDAMGGSHYKPRKAKPKPKPKPSMPKPPPRTQEIEESELEEENLDEELGELEEMDE